MSLTDTNTSASITGLYNTGKPASAVTMTEEELVWGQHWQMNAVHSLLSHDLTQFLFCSPGLRASRKDSLAVATHSYPFQFNSTALECLRSSGKKVTRWGQH